MTADRLSNGAAVFTYLEDDSISAKPCFTHLGVLPVPSSVADRDRLPWVEFARSMRYYDIGYLAGVESNGPDLVETWATRMGGYL